MNFVPILIYTGLLYASTFFASFFFGFIKGFQEARKNPLSPKAIAIMRYLEWALELVFAIGVTAAMSARNSQNAFELSLLAYALLTLILYFVDVKLFRGRIQEFWIRFGIAYVICLPAGILLAPYAIYGS